MSQIDLLKINVNDHTEKKNGLTYLSWAWAWAEVLKADPAADFGVQMFPKSDGSLMPYMNVNGTGLVWVTVTMFGKPISCQLPVMDYRNKPIPDPDAFAVNTAIMRCLVKAVALHGLGLYIYAGEDLPQDEAQGVTTVVSVQQTARIEELIKNALGALNEGGTEEDVKAGLFTQGIIEYISLSTTEDGLKDYWKKNQATLDELKVSHPGLYEGVRNKFANHKAQIMLKEKGKK